MTLAQLPPIVSGCLLMPSAIGLLATGGASGAAQLCHRNEDDYFDITIAKLDTSTPVVMVNELPLASHKGAPGWLVNSLEADVRLRITSVDDGRETFIGIALDGDVDNYLSGVAHAKVARVVDGKVPVYNFEEGSDDIPAPLEQSFWVASASGAGTQELVWRATRGNWSIVVMNADGSPGVSAEVDAGLKVSPLGRLTVAVALAGAAMAAASVALIVAGAAHTDVGLKT
jgi:hypothetical protein